MFNGKLENIFFEGGGVVWVRVALIHLCDFIMGLEIRRVMWTALVFANCLIVFN